MEVAMAPPKLTLRKKERVFKHFVTQRNERNHIVKPKNPLSSVKGLSPREVLDYLHILEHNGYIIIQTADFPECDGIWNIGFTSAGLDYFPARQAARKQARNNFVMNMVFILLSAFLGWALSLLTMFLTGQLSLPQAEEPLSAITAIRCYLTFLAR